MDTQSQTGICEKAEDSDENPWTLRRQMYRLAQKRGDGGGQAGRQTRAARSVPPDASAVEKSLRAGFEYPRSIWVASRLDSVSGVDPESIRSRSGGGGVDQEAIRALSGSGSIWAPISRVDPGSGVDPGLRSGWIRGRFVRDPGPIRGRCGHDPWSVQGRFGADPVPTWLLTTSVACWRPPS